MIVSLIKNDIIVNDKIIPDISVGIQWAKYWKDNKFESKYGKWVGYKHNYPDYYPQAASNPQEANAYPNESLHIFRKWFEEIYLISKFLVYILNQSKKGKIERDIANKAVKSIGLLQFNKNT